MDFLFCAAVLQTPFTWKKEHLDMMFELDVWLYLRTAIFETHQ